LIVFALTIDKSMKILLFGKSGQLGWELNRTLASLGHVHAFGSTELDVGNLKALERVIQEVQPAIILNATAYTAVDRAEEQPELAQLLNARAPAVMAEAAHRINGVLIHYSTDYVFDGAKNSAYNEKDATNPLNVYGRTKLNGEDAIGQIGGANIILRTSWVYSMRGMGFVSKVLSWARKQDSLKIVSDQIGSPTWARMLAEVTAMMIAQSLAAPREYFSQRSGIYHLGGSGSVSRFDFVEAILRLDPHPAEQTTKIVQPAQTTDFPTPALRPLVTPLDCSYFERIFGLRLPPWEAALRLAMAGDE
jgi:dTDP-4-dehydrorhamnose reductase